MDELKKWVTLAVLASVVVLAAGWFLAVSPKRAEAADLRAQAEQQVSANSALETQLQVLRAQAKDLPKKQAELAAVAAKIPSDPALPSLVRALIAASESSGVQLVTVAPGTPTPVAVAAPAPAAAPPPATAASGQTAPNPAAPAGAAPPVDPAAAATAAGPAGTLATISVEINVVGDYFEVQAFVRALEELPRALRITTLGIVPGASPTKKETVSTDDGRSLAAQISGTVFMAADRPEATAVVVPSDPTAPAPAAAGAAAATTPAAPAAEESS